MNDPSEEGAVLHKGLAEHPSLDEEAEKRRQYVAANRDRIREMNRRWRSEHLDRARELNRDSMRRAAARRHREAEVRARGREWAKRWREEHLDRKREYQQRWVTKNREKVREYYSRYYESHRDEVNARAAARRDADPERTKQITRQWAERNKERRAELQRTRRSDPEVYQSELEVNAAARRLKRILSRAGLPPKRIHVATAAERRADEREADAYFNDPSRPEHLRQFTVFAESLTEHMLKNDARMREFADAYVSSRARIGLPPVSVDDVVYARAVEIVAERMRRVDLLTGRDVAAAVRATTAMIRREERQQQFERLIRTVVTHAHRNSARFRVDAEMDNQARTHRVKPRVPVESLVVQLAMQEVFGRVPTNRLTIDDARSVARVAKQHVAMSFQAPADAVDERIHRPSAG
ncbi:hypothetical protein [Cryobacterium luteum]|uniref:Uncharacterized protein n=1 Tax=Cryobacterium luteum TaxID=1424661 RepID=A0A1H8EPT4_9MICO|nr:hypothetical protein [Cryobacterium luteum]TFB85780.1 hypothetical protein E3O10_14590 [Cryobacterium luteum]SEN21406.1 hypothetical protein SAMN05216281_10520 [Cryobacterium luteum]